ncbi:hypothetical protein [Cupriavidus necator]
MSNLGLIFSHPDVSAFANEFVGAQGYTHLVVSFSAWNSKGNGTPFGPGFFNSRKMPAIFVVQHRNHWWHTDALFTLAERVKQLAAAQGLGIFCYGSSMGGYGSLHFSNIFHANRSIAIAPQIFISKGMIPEEKRWESERERVGLLFEEIENLRNIRCESFIFYDARHAQDTLHVQKLMSAGVGANFHTVEVPFALHDVARALVKVRDFKNFVVESGQGSKVDLDRLRLACAAAHEFDDKVFLNRIRHTPISKIEDSEKSRLLEVALINAERLDFEALYFAAEGLMNLGLHQQAVVCSSLSLEKYPMKVVPRYLELKHERILKAYEASRRAA